MKREEFNLEEIEKIAIEQFKTGKSLVGSDGAFAPLLKRVIEKALEAEMEAHVNEEERSQGNKRSGKGKKTIESGHGSLEIATPEDRQRRFERDIVKKRQ